MIIENQPSTYTKAYWLSATNRTDENNMSPIKRKTGKWLIFLPLQELDAKWEQIKAATEQGKLGYYSAVSTVKHDTHPKGSHRYINKVICVFTYSENDYDDIVRVRDALRLLGYNENLGYKTWKATKAGRFAHLGHRNICKYRL